MEKSHQKHRILVSNDDGIDAPGVLSIVEEVRALPSNRSIAASIGAFCSTWGGEMELAPTSSDTSLLCAHNSWLATSVSRCGWRARPSNSRRSRTR
jgi:hypothetical protein